jgi:hypothetical protein
LYGSRGNLRRRSAIRRAAFRGGATPNKADISQMCDFFFFMWLLKHIKYVTIVATDKVKSNVINVLEYT